MKQIIFAFLMLASCASFGQTTMKLTPFTGSSGTYVSKSTPDTTSGTDTTYLQNISPFTTDYNITYRATLTNVTNTTGGYIFAQGSDDNVNWYLVHRSSIEEITATDSVTISGLTSGGTKTFSYKWPSHQFPYYRFEFISSGSSQTSVMVGSADLVKKVVKTQTN